MTIMNNRTRKNPFAVGSVGDIDSSDVERVGLSVSFESRAYERG